MKNIPLIVKILGSIIVTTGFASIYLIQYRTGLFIFIIINFALVSLAMNYKNGGTERNAWDVWFFSMPGVLVALLFVGIFGQGEDPMIWRWVTMTLGGAVALESLSSIIKALK